MDAAALRQQRTDATRRRRRRRLVASGALVLAGIITAAIVALAGGADSGPRTTAAGEHGTVADRTAAAPAAAAAAAGAPAAAPAPAPPPAPATFPAPDAAVPILMYHVIGRSTNPPRLPRLWVSRAAFASHVRALKRAGYHGVTLQQVWDAWHDDGRLPRKPIVFSFDDGYEGHARDALPILRSAGWPGVLNLELNSLAVMGGTKAVKRLLRGGWEIDAHTLTHPDLTTLSASQLRSEVAGSRAKIKRLFGVPANFFCYPSGRLNETVVAAVQEAGYLAATTVTPGYAQPDGSPFELPRVRVDGGKGGAWLLGRLRELE